MKDVRLDAKVAGSILVALLLALLMMYFAFPDPNVAP